MEATVHGTATLDIERLLAHEGFLRELAVRLVADPQSADDIVQDTWVAALERPTAVRTSARGWLAAVARNAARMRRRSGARRSRRERQVARPEAIPSPADLVERERTRRLVLSAVLRLEEPYRSTVILRFYDSLPPRAVARRLGVPVETVRTRTRRALERMRQDLDRRHESRRAWSALLVPFLSPGPGASASAALGGVLLMSAKIRALAVVLLALLLGGGATWLALDLGGSSGDGREGGTPLAGGSPAEEATLVGRAPQGGGADAEGAPGEPGLDIFRKTRARGVLRGFVYSGRTHEPVADALVEALMERGKTPNGMFLRSRPMEGTGARTDARGRFVIEDVPLGAWRVRVTHAEEGVAEAVGVAAADPQWLRLYPLPERSDERTFLVRVVDEQKRAVPGARVECVCGLGAEPIVTETDAEGLARIQDVPFVEHSALGWVTASAGGALGRIPLSLDLLGRRTRTDPHELVLAPGGAIEGRLAAPAGADLDGIRVAALCMTGGQGTWANAVEQTAVADADGAFRLARLPAGTYTILVQAHGGLRMDLPTRENNGPDDWDPLRVEVEAGRTANVEVPLIPGGTIRGRVVTTDGSPVAGCRVEVHLPQGPWDYPERVLRRGVPLWRLDSVWPDARRFELTWRVLATDGEGRYEATGLLPGPYRVRVVPEPHLSFDRQEPVDVRDGAVVEVEHRVEPAGTLELVTRPSDSLGLRRVGSATFAATFVTPSGHLGALTIPGLPVGAWEVLHVHSDPSIEPVAAATFQIREGELTYLDVSDRGDARIRLRLLDRGRPVAGALVDGLGYGRSALVTDEDGCVSWAETTYGREWGMSKRVVPPDPDALPLAVTVSSRDRDVTASLPTGRLRIRVLDANGRTVEGARVAVRARQERREPASGEVRAASGEDLRATDAAGVARWRHVPPGEYGVEVRLPSSEARASGAVTVSDGTAELEIAVSEPGQVRLRVLQEDGTAVAGARVGCAVLPAGLPAQDWSHAVTLTENGWRTDAEGGFLVRGAPEGTARIYAWVMDDHGWMATHNAQTEVEVLPGETVEVELRLQPVPR